MDSAWIRARPIFLVGMMGSGKSTVGPLLARRLGRDFVDNDAVVEARAGRRIAEIFARDGEPAFRELEVRAIEEVAAGRSVVALGGGAIAQPGAPERLARLGTVVYLQASPRELARRVGPAEARPLLAGLDEEQRAERLAGLLRQREAAYRSARIVVETEGASAAEVVDRIAAALAEGAESEGEDVGKAGTEDREGAS